MATSPDALASKAPGRSVSSPASPSEPDGEVSSAKATLRYGLLRLPATRPNTEYSQWRTLARKGGVFPSRKTPFGGPAVSIAISIPIALQSRMVAVLTFARRYLSDEEWLADNARISEIMIHVDTRDDIGIELWETA
ncbi:MAG: hypothetical protein IPO08_22015 [Xanthomonadales bacterium]|nr:hypothetical protein [Xanthomonadales bacterium]